MYTPVHLIVRSEESANDTSNGLDALPGDLRPGTKAGVGVGLRECTSFWLLFPLIDSVVCTSAVLFIVLIISFWVVANWKRATKTPQQLSPAAQFTRESYERWQNNISGPGKSSRQEHQRHTSYTFSVPPPPHRIRRDSSISGSTIVERDDDWPMSAAEMQAPPPAYFPAGQVEAEEGRGSKS